MPPVYQCNCIELQPTARDAAINYLVHGIPVAGDCRGKGFGVRAVRARFEAYKHKTMATLRKDGSPRISGMEASFSDGELWLGTMSGSRKALDLRRDPRLALHSATNDAEMAAGDAKIAGTAVEVSDHRFRVDLTEVVLTSLGGDPPDHLVIESWQQGKG